MRWVCLFHCKDRNSFEVCLCENDVIPSREQRALVRKELAETNHAKLLLKTDQPVCIKCLVMLNNDEVTEWLLVVGLGANFVLLFFIAWHVATARLYFRQAIAIVKKMDCDEHDSMDHRGLSLRAKTCACVPVPRRWWQARAKRPR